MLIFIHHKNSNKDFRKILTQPSAVALVGKFKKWSQISALLLKTCIFDVRSSTKKLGSKFGLWLYRRAHHYWPWAAVNRAELANFEINSYF